MYEVALSVWPWIVHELIRRSGVVRKWLPWKEGDQLVYMLPMSLTASPVSRGLPSSRLCMTMSGSRERFVVVGVRVLLSKVVILSMWFR